MWPRDATSSQVVQLLQQAWQLQVEESHGFKLARKIQQARDKLKEWNKTQFGYARTRIKELEKKIEEIQNRAPTQENLDVEASIVFKVRQMVRMGRSKVKTEIPGVVVKGKRLEFKIFSFINHYSETKEPYH